MTPPSRTLPAAFLGASFSGSPSDPPSLMPRHIGEVFLAGMVVNQADDEGPHDRTPLLIKREARPPLFPEYFAGRLKWFHATPVESARALEPIGRLTIRSA